MNPMVFGNLGAAELVVNGIIIMLLFGGAALPKLMRSLGRARGEFARARHEMEKEMEKGEKDSTPPADEETSEPVRASGTKAIPVGPDSRR